MGKDREVSESGRGTIVAFATYGTWGLFPLYWKQLGSVPSLQILCHRIVWALVFSILLLAATRRLGAFAAIFKDRSRALSAAASGFLVTANWGVYIWAVNAGRGIEASLGYYINPLVSVALGALFFKERIDRWTAVAVGLAAAGVAAASIMLGAPPWVSVVLALSFAFYGAFKKMSSSGPVEGLAAETAVVAPLALAWLVLEHRAGRGALGGPDLKVNVMLLAAGVATAVPLLGFAYASRRITLQRLGFIQYFSPTIQLALSILVFHERLSPALATACVSVVSAALLYALTRRRPTSGS